ncbi:MAG: hypothetical protein GX981_11130 [Tissierellia bacterium]|nr:hypothetical protein [Tissierellia bacterium]
MSKPQIASEEYRKFRKEVSRMASMANKRLKRLERNELTDLPAYQSWVKGGAVRFGVRGKDYNQVQSEFWRLKRFLDNKTSLVRGANKYLKEIAENTGIKYNGLADLKTKSKKFFELANKIKEYYKMSELNALALDYQKIWEQINVQVKQGIIELTDIESTEQTLQRFIDEIDRVSQVENNQEGFKEGIKEWDFIKI